MPRAERDSLPAEIVDLLDGSALETKVGDTFLLATVSEGGHPHLAMLSVGEVIALAPDILVLVLWQGTETGANLARGQRATLVIVAHCAGYYVEIESVSRDTIEVEGSALDRFRCRVVRVLHDEVGYARLTSGITFTLPDEAAVVARWRTTVEAALEP